MPDQASSSAPAQEKRKLFLPSVIAVLFIIGGLIIYFATEEKHIAPEQAVYQGMSAHPDQATIPLSMRCGACHQEIFQEWAASDHAWAHRDLTPKWDAEAFHGSSLEAHGTTFTFSTNESGQRILTDKKTGKNWTMDMVVGRTPLIQYLTKGEDGGYHTTSAAWDVNKQEWFDMFGEDARTPGEWGYWTGRGMIWNTQCAWCHMSGFQKNYDTGEHKYHSSWQEPGVTCLQCHGPVLDEAEKATGCLVDTSRKYSIKQQADNCASCHARRAELDNDFKIGDKFEDHFLLVLPTHPGLYWPNGMQRDEVYTETGLKLSRMGKAGVQCLDCHTSHSGKLKFPFEDNSLCLQCHKNGERNAPVIDPLSHSHHKPDSTGNRCVECHMPESNYMVRDPRRDHSFCSPDPVLSRELNIPNSCIMCHTDKSNAWAEDYVKQWYGDLPLTSRRERTRAVEKAYRNEDDAFSSLLQVIKKEENSAWKATLLELLDPWSTHPEVAALARTAAKSEHSLERVAAARILGRIKSPDAVPLLQDPIKTVRVQAAWELRDLLQENMPAMKELEDSSLHQADQPGGAMKLAQIYSSRATLNNNTAESAAAWNKKAEYWFRKACEWDPSSSVVYRDFSVFLASQGRTVEAVSELEKAITHEPKNASLYYLLALAQAETGKQEQAIASLDKTLELDPGYPRAAYNRALLHHAGGNLEKALQDLTLAEKTDPGNPEYGYTRAVLLYQAGKKQEAKKEVLELKAKYPDFPPADQLLQELR